MKMTKVLGLSLTAMAASVGSASLSAAEQLEYSPGFYVLATAGSTELDYGSSAIFSGNGYGIGIGYDVSNYFAVEASYMNYFDMVVGTTGYKADGLTARALLRYPTGSWSPFIGLAYATANESLTLSGTTYTSAGSNVGGTAGFEVALTDTVAFRLNADSYTTDGVDQYVTQMGIVARF